jgi:hypothetical protein
MKEQSRLLHIEKEAEKLVKFCKEVNKVIFLKTLPPPAKLTDEEMIEKFKIKATGMIENLLEIMTTKY